ncbi:Glycosyl hydrolase family 9 [Popillia japonica]|uniref:cellulase n=1 Tax=Popillia japonica TaxID=7064 RepID=A0AAW1KPV1_POPJA
MTYDRKFTLVPVSIADNFLSGALKSETVIEIKMRYFTHFYTVNILWVLFGCTNPTEIDIESYKEVIAKSLKFYKAQRSGRLPDNDIPWRSHSALNDRGQNGEDLSGGYYDASDYVKFGFTMAFTTTILSWGVISFADGYKAAGQYDDVLDAVKWATDYFIKCHVSKNELYGQVGDFDIDLKYWGRPEDMNMSRPAYKIDEEHPGSNLAGQVAAAFAASSIIFKNINQTYSQELLKHAIELFNFANQYRGLYQETIPGAKSFYEDIGYGEELTWSAIWLYKATNEGKYLKMAKSFYETYRLGARPNEFYFNEIAAGIQLLLAEITNNDEFKTAVDSFCSYSIDKQTRTPKGLVFIDKLGTLSHAANIAFICLQAVELGLDRRYGEFAKEQIDYMLGKNGRSYVVGFGKDYPKRPHNAASSCPDKPAPCGWKQLTTSQVNPQILEGALVSGPDLEGALVSGPDNRDYYEDIREEFLFNDVTLDYNAGFQSALAGLVMVELARNGTDSNN